MIEQRAIKVTLGYKQTKPNAPIMTPSPIKVYQAHATQPNVRNMVTDFNNSCV